jgi:hypothetical protein
MQKLVATTGINVSPEIWAMRLREYNVDEYSSWRKSQSHIWYSSIPQF